MAPPETTISEPAPPPTATEPRRRVSLWGWVPAGVVLVLAATVLWAYGVTFGDLARFAAYLLLAITIPGTLLWRALRGGPGHLVADAAAGAVLGYAIEVLAYVAARAAGVPRLTLAVPAAIILAFLAVPGLRRFWRGSGERAPLWWSWLVALGAALMVAWSAAAFFRTHGLTEPANVAPYVDMPFHLALAGEVKHHVPPVTPYVQGEPLNYHWFVYADLAATSWATGVELETLLFRLSILAMLVLTVALLAVLGRTITSRWWPGPLAVGITVFAVAPSPFAWINGPVTDASTLGVLWLSPTQTFGAMLFAPLVLLLVELLRGEPNRGTAGRWVLLTLLVAAVTGAKATFLPLLLAALLVVLVGYGIARRRLHWAALGAFGLTTVALGVAQVVLFDGSNGGLAVELLGTIRESGIDVVTGLTGGDDELFVGPMVLLAAICVFCWLCIWAGALGLFRRRGAWSDPAHLLCLGIGAAGLGAALTFNHPGLSQLYFFQSARPYLALLAAAGLAVAIADSEHRARTLWLLAPVVLAGIGVVWLLRLTGEAEAPTRAADGGSALVAALAMPYLLLVALVGVVTAGLILVRRQPLVGQIGFAVVLALMSGFALQAVKARYWSPFEDAIDHGWTNSVHPDALARPAIPAGAVASARWLRDHSSPTDLVATNAHCRVGRTQPECDSRNFWVSAYTERRVLLEGWAYTPTAHAISEETKTPHALVPYWDQQRFADNETAFQGPSEASTGRLRDGYGVRWLLVDEQFDIPPATLDDFATERFRAGSCAVYELVRP